MMAVDALGPLVGGGAYPKSGPSQVRRPAMTRTTRTTRTNASAPSATPTAPKGTRRGQANANPPANPAAAPTGAEMLAMLGGVATAKDAKVKPAKAQAVKAQARRDLAQTLVSAYAEAFAKIPADSPIFAALGREEAAQFAANWVHHLPVTAAAFGENLPLPARSNWDGDHRK